MILHKFHLIASRVWDSVVYYIEIFLLSVGFWVAIAIIIAAIAGLMRVLKPKIIVPLKSSFAVLRKLKDRPESADLIPSTFHLVVGSRVFILGIWTF